VRTQSLRKFWLYPVGLATAPPLHLFSSMEEGAGRVPDERAERRARRATFAAQETARSKARSRSVGRSVGRSVDRSVGRSVARPPFPPPPPRRHHAEFVSTKCQRRGGGTTNKLAEGLRAHVASPPRGAGRTPQSVLPDVDPRPGLVGSAAPMRERPPRAKNAGHPVELGQAARAALGGATPR
jgi:hypothetical protein